MEIEVLKSKIRDIVDFPSKGVVFKDLTTLIKDGEALREMADAIYEMYKDMGITKIVGIESRGFITGSILAYKLGCHFLPTLIRSKWSQPRRIIPLQLRPEP